MDRGNKCFFSHHPTHNQAIRKLHPTTCRTESESNPGSPPPLPLPLCQQPRLSPGPAAQPHPALLASMSAPLWLLSAWSRRGAIKTEGRACPTLLPALQGCSCIQEPLPNTSAVLGFHALFSLCGHVNMPAPHPPQGLCPCSILCPKHSSPGLPLTLLPSGLCSYVSIFHLNTWIHSTPISTLLCPPGADCGN